MPPSPAPYFPGFLVAATNSGAGKTLCTLGLLAAFARRGLLVQPFKCGPDFIDPTLHRAVTGRVSRNLDIRMCGEEFVREGFQRHTAGKDLAVVEGVMGLFDGGPSSSAALARLLDLPVLLLLDARSMAESAAAVVLGFETMERAPRLAGVLLNQVGSPRHRQLLTAAIAAHCRTPVLGSLRRDPAFSMPSRHLGLHMGEECPLPPAALEQLATVLEENLDLDRLLRTAGGRTVRRQSPPAPTPGAAAPEDAPPAGGVRIAVARDRAFCFTYEDNLDLLRAAGAEIVFFSPLTDSALPAGTDAVILGGGYPELFAGELAANAAMRAAILEWSGKGRPLYAECGGFMYLAERLVTDRGVAFPMAGVFPVTATMDGRLRRLGYRELRCRRDSLLGPAGALLRGHEFHYSDTSPMPEEIERVCADDENGLACYRLRGTVAGYAHIHFGCRPETAAWFTASCKGEKK